MTVEEAIQEFLSQLDFATLTDDDLVAINAPIVAEWRRRYPIPPAPEQEAWNAVNYRVLGAWMNVRKQPSTSAEIVNRVDRGETIAMLGITEQADGYLWRCTSTKLWVAEATLSGLKYLEKLP